MKQYRLQIVMMAILLCLLSGSVFAQDAPKAPAAGLTFDYNRDRVQYEGQAAPATQELVSDFVPPTEALMPCPVEVSAATVCDVIATQPEDIVGVWALYFQSNPAFIRYTMDNLWVLGNSVESTSDTSMSIASGTYSFDDKGVFTSFFTVVPLDVVPLECQAGRYILRLIKVGGQPVALNHAVIADCFVNREADWRYTMLRVSAE